MAISRKFSSPSRGRSMVSFRKFGVTCRAIFASVLVAMLSVGSVATAQGARVKAIVISPQGAVLQQGSKLQFNVRCTYVDGNSDDCSSAGGIWWGSSDPSKLLVSNLGLATWIGNLSSGDPFALSNVLVSAGQLRDRAAVMGQHIGDVFYQYPTPDYRNYSDPGSNALLPLKVVVGATVTIGSGFVINHAVPGEKTGSPFQMTCNWNSSSPTIATVDRYGQVSARAPGDVTINCGRAGNGVYGTVSNQQWVPPGNQIALKVLAGERGNTTWYVRPKGGTPFVSRSTTPRGQCDGKHDADYPGKGFNQPCALGDFEFLYFDQVTHSHGDWMIAGGDTVIVRQRPEGYNTAIVNNDHAYNPTNCSDMEYCDVPSIPSGSASRHTRILGENYEDCRSDSKKTLLVAHGREALSVKDSQFTDIACFEITDKAACGPGQFKNGCAAGGQGGTYGIVESALTSETTYKDIFIHGLVVSGIYGATGVGVLADHIHIRGMPMAGIDMDDGPWLSSNISVAGGFTLTHSMTEFTGCVEEYPVVHKYPYIECRDQNAGGYGDGFGTGSTVGSWIFDTDVWRYNFQDGLDLLHSGMQSLTVVNSSSYGNDGQAYKVGAADSVIFRNNIAIENCNRIGSTIGDEPSSAIVLGVATCRANGDWIPLNFMDWGTYLVQNNTLVGYGTVPFDMACETGWSDCSHANAVYQNNVMLGYSDRAYSGGDLPSTFYEANVAMPPREGWAVRDHNLYYHVRHCPTALAPTEICNSKDPLFLSEPSSPIHSESDLDYLDLHPSRSSPLIGRGVAIAGIEQDSSQRPRGDPPAIGALEYDGTRTAAVIPVGPAIEPPWYSRLPIAYPLLSCAVVICGALWLYRHSGH